jgi:CRP/FNR family transcriptional regulator, cyclic AMP receptor protein
MRQNRTIRNELRQVPLFSACTDAELDMIARTTTAVLFAAGDVVAQEGARGHEFMVIVEGRAKVVARGHCLAELGAGDFFGEIALLDGGPRTASVIAETDLLVEVIARRDFDALTARAPGMDRKLLAGLARRLRDADRQLVG